MRCVFTLTMLALLTGALTRAGTITDPFNQPQSNCNYNFGPTFSNCDVIGDEMKFDIQKADVQVSTSSIDVTIYFNYGGGSSLSGFNDGINLQGGDLFFYDPSSPQTSAYDPNNSYPEYQYGVPLTSHGGMIAGNLYQISNFNSLVTANDLIDNSGYYYRRTDPVWMPAGETLAAQGNGVSVANYGNGVTNALYAVTIETSTPSGFLNLISNGEIGVGFNSATCGNDVLLGSVNVGNPGGNVPEPQTFGMFAVGIGLIACGVWRRKKKQS